MLPLFFCRELFYRASPPARTNEYRQLPGDKTGALRSKCKFKLSLHEGVQFPVTSLKDGATRFCFKPNKKPRLLVELSPLIGRSQRNYHHKM